MNSTENKKIGEKIFMNKNKVMFKKSVLRTTNHDRQLCIGENRRIYALWANSYKEK